MEIQYYTILIVNLPSEKRSPPTSKRARSVVNWLVQLIDVFEQIHKTHKLFKSTLSLQFEKFQKTQISWLAQFCFTAEKYNSPASLSSISCLEVFSAFNFLPWVRPCSGSVQERLGPHPNPALKPFSSEGRRFPSWRPPRRSFLLHSKMYTLAIPRII